MSIEFDKTLVSKVVKELLDFEKRKSNNNELLGSYSNPVMVQIQLGKEIKDSVIRPIRIQIPNNMFSPENEDHSVCVFCKSEDKEQIDELLSNSPINGIKTVISLSQVKKLYASYKDKKELLSSHTHFVCDENIYSHLCNLLGKVFGKRNNYPLPMRLSKVIGLPSALSNVLSATYMHLVGKSITIRFGHTGMKSNEIVDNIMSGLKSALSKFPQQGKTVQGILCKLSNSPSLPIYSRHPDSMLDYIKQKTSTELVKKSTLTSSSTDNSKSKAKQTKKRAGDISDNEETKPVSSKKVTKLTKTSSVSSSASKSKIK